MRNPFSKENYVLINISTGLHAFREVQSSLLSCVNNGNAKVQAFINGALDSVGTINLHESIKQTKLVTFAHMTKKMKLKSKGGFKLAHTCPDLIMRRSLAITKYRPELTLLNIMSVTTGGSPLSPFHEDGLMRSPENRADLTYVLE